MCHYPPYQRLPLLCHRERRPLRRASDGNCIIVGCSTTSDTQPTMTQVRGAPTIYCFYCSWISHHSVVIFSGEAEPSCPQNTHSGSCPSVCLSSLEMHRLHSVLRFAEHRQKHRCRWFLAVQNSSIGDLVTDSVTDWLTNFYFWHYRVTLETCDLWDIWSEWWRDMIWLKKDLPTNIPTHLPTYLPMYLH